MVWGEINYNRQFVLPVQLVYRSQAKLLVFRLKAPTTNFYRICDTKYMYYFLDRNDVAYHAVLTDVILNFYKNTDAQTNSITLAPPLWF